jgi:hypothetical protein
MLPEVTPLQFLVVGLLFEGPQGGEELRRRISACGVPLSPPGFSRLVDRMERLGYLQIFCQNGPRGCRRVFPRRFEVTDLGVAIWTQARDFYASAAPPPAELVAIATAEGKLAHLSRPARRKILTRRARQKVKRIFSRFRRRTE